MSQAHLEIVQRAIAAFNAADVDGLRQAFSAEPSITPLRAALETETRFTGLRAVEEFWTTAQADWTHSQLDIESIEAVGERVLVIAQYSGRTRDSAVPFTQRIGFVAHFESAKICQLVTYVHPPDALKAVGLSE